MKKHLFVLTFLLFSNYIISQKFTEKDIIGRWKVVKILKKPASPNFNDLIKSFGSATFEFKENSDFKITTSDKTKLFTLLTDMTNNSKWKLNKDKFAINVGNESDHFSILKVNILEINGKIIFHMSETELDLEVQKE